MTERVKYPYAHNLLYQALIWEESMLQYWEITAADEKDEASVRQAKGNIPSTEHRIKELKEVIELVKQQK